MAKAVQKPFDWSQGHVLKGYLYAQPKVVWSGSDVLGAPGPSSGQQAYHYQAFFYLGASSTIPAVPTGLYRLASRVWNVNASAWTKYINGGANNDFAIAVTGTWKSPSAGNLIQNNYQYNVGTASGSERYSSKYFRRLRGASSGAECRVFSTGPGFGQMSFGTGNFQFGPKAEYFAAGYCNIYPECAPSGSAVKQLQIYTNNDRSYVGTAMTFMEKSSNPDWLVIAISRLAASGDLWRAIGPTDSSATWNGTVAYSGGDPFVNDPGFTGSGEVCYYDWTSATAPAQP